MSVSPLTVTTVVAIIMAMGGGLAMQAANLPRPAKALVKHRWVGAIVGVALAGGLCALTGMAANALP